MAKNVTDADAMKLNILVAMVICPYLILICKNGSSIMLFQVAMLLQNQTFTIVTDANIIC